MTYATLLNDSLYAITTEAIVRLDPSPGHRDSVSAAAPNKSEAAADPQADEASLSHSSLLLAHALTLSDVRTDRVAQLRQVIDAGTYRISAATVAKKLMQTIEI